MRAFAPLQGRLTFAQVPGNRPCVTAQQGAGPAYVVFFRHCDEGYSCPHKPAYAGCRGCEFIKQDACATDDCGDKTNTRAYGYARWLACFAARAGAPVAAVFSQDPTRPATNARPMTTAAALYDGLLRVAGAAPASLCWMQFDRTAASAPANNPMVQALGRAAFAGKTVAVVWDHGNVQYILRALGVSLGNWWWNGCCYDQAVVVTMRTRAMATYRLGGTAAAPDPCAGAVCQAAAGPFAGCAGPWVPIPDEVSVHPLSAADADPSPDAVAMRGPA
ncbi:MAG: hypothetical protein V4537_14080 [Pseudomonadota bacterium]